MVEDNLITEMLMARYENLDMGSRLEEGKFKDAVRDFYPKLSEQYADQSIYGISFEIANVVQKVYSDDFYTIVYINTEEMYEENIKDCDDDEKDYYRFEPWSEWEVISAESLMFEKVQDYLKLNSLGIFSSATEYRDELPEETVAWYEGKELDFEDIFDAECEQIRMWLAEALGELREEGFWSEQENAGIYVIPFSGEDDIDFEEVAKTFGEMDRGCHGTEFLDYLKGDMEVD